MSSIKLPSFELATLQAGDINSPKLALVLPGRLDTKDYANNPSHINYLATKGYFSLSFDPPGTWDSPGGIELFTTTNYIKSVNELIEHFGNRPTLLMGHSRGGSVAMLTATKNPHVSHLVAVFSNYGAPGAPNPHQVIDGKLTELRDLPPGTSRTEKKITYELPMEYFIDGKQYNALDGLRAYHKPKLFFYGDQDIENDPANIKKAYEVAADPKMLKSVNSEHDYRLHPEIIDEINEAVGEFLDKYGN